MPNSRTLYPSLLAALLLVSQLLQSQGQAFSLEEAVSYGLEHRTELENATFDKYIAKRQADEILAQGYPQINATVTGQWNYQLQSFVFPDFNDPTKQQILQVGTPLTLSAGATLDQLLFDGTFFIGLKGARAFVDVAATRRASTAEQLTYDITSAYFQALIAQKQIALLEANLDRLKKLYDETKARYDEGFVEKLDVDRLQVNYNNLLLERQKAARMVTLSNNLLKFQMGLPIETELELTTTVDESSEIPRLELEPEFSYDDRIDYIILNKQIGLEGINTQRYRAGYLPSAYLFGNYSWNYIGGEGAPEDRSQRDYTVGALGVRINIPIFDGLRKHALIQQSKLAIRQLENQRQRLEEAIDLELANTKTELINAYENLEALSRNAGLAQRVYEVSKIKYEEGVGSSLEVNDASSQLKEAQVNYLNGLLQYYVSRVAYDKARGKFVPENE